MDKRYYLLIGIVAAFVIGTASYTITGMTAVGEERGCGIEPYEAGVVLSGEETVCAAGDLVDVYGKDGWVFIDEYEAPHTIYANDSEKGFECYSCPNEAPDIVLWLILVVLVIAVISFFTMKRKKRA